MMRALTSAILMLGLIGIACSSNAAEGSVKDNSLWEIFNFTDVDDRIASAGHPEDHHFKQVREAGYDVVVNLVPYSESGRAHKQRKIAEQLQMAFVHIPVDWHAPTFENVDVFFATMDKFAGKRVFVHCEANMRASAFLYLYRTLGLAVPESKARKKMNEIWVPEGVWQELVTGYPEHHRSR